MITGDAQQFRSCRRNIVFIRPRTTGRGESASWLIPVHDLSHSASTEPDPYLSQPLFRIKAKLRAVNGQHRHVPYGRHSHIDNGRHSG